MRSRLPYVLLAAALVMVAAPVRAEEGMWTFDDVPAGRVAQDIGVHLDRTWLEHLSGASARLTSGCSAAVVSPQGLMLTNQHCVLTCEQSLSRPGADIISDGLMTDSRTEERVCPGLQAETLMAIEDVTGTIFASSAHKFGDDYVKAREQAIAHAESSFCRGDPRMRCQVISFYGGGLFKVYKFRRFDDVRLVFAPEFDIAFFGGDKDNFSFPRHDLDCAFLRLYENGRPAATPTFLPWSSAPPRAGEPVFVAGNPAATERGFTVAQMQFERDVVLPISIAQHERLRERLLAFARLGPDQGRMVADRLFEEDNDLKVLRGRAAVLADQGFLNARAEEESVLKARLAGNTRLAAQVGDPWAEIAAVRGDFVNDYTVWRQLEMADGGGSQLFAWARALVRAGVERTLPPSQRLPEYADSRLPLVRKSVLDDRVVFPDLDRLYLEVWLEETRNALGATSPAIASLLGDDQPGSLARRLVEGSGLGDPAVRRALWEGGWPAIQRSGDPLIVYVLRTDPLARAARRLWEDDVQGPLNEASTRIARVRYAIDGSSLYPDATFSPRLSYGKVAGWGAGVAQVAPFTTFSGLYASTTGVAPYRLPARWQARRGAINPDTVFNFSTTNDISGGNSGSPVVNEKGEIIGDAFDGNRASIAGDYAYDGASNRTVALSTAAIGEALAKVYGRTALMGELDRR